MAEKKGLFQSKGFKKAVHILYSWGASVVILGALFKILHLPGANEMLILGLGTESAIFFISGLEPLPPEEKHWDWSRVYPQLKDETDDVLDDVDLTDELGGGTSAVGVGLQSLGMGLNVTSDALQEANLTPELFENLTESIKNLGISVEGISKATASTLEVEGFNEKLKEASAKIESLTTSYASAIEVMDEFGGALGALKEYKEKILKVNQTLDEMVTVYDTELKDIQKHLNTLNKFYASIGSIMENIASEEFVQASNELKTEMVGLVSNVKNLNKVYGEMVNTFAKFSV